MRSSFRKVLEDTDGYGLYFSTLTQTWYYEKEFSQKYFFCDLIDCELVEEFETYREQEKDEREKIISIPVRSLLGEIMFQSLGHQKESLFHLHFYKLHSTRKERKICTVLAVQLTIHSSEKTVIIIPLLKDHVAVDSALYRKKRVFALQTLSLIRESICLSNVTNKKGTDLI